MEKANKIKKYLFYISIFFVFIIGSHFGNLYLYHDAEITPVEGGNISEGFIGDFPHLNPLINSSNYNEYIISLLYRSLVKYDTETKTIVSDLAKCDIKNLEYVECYLNQNIKWSNGKDITIDDIISTYDIIKKYKLNPNLNSILENTTIEEKSGIITFSNRIKNVNFMNLLFQPIVSKETINKIKESELNGNFNPFNGIYSNKYKIESLGLDDSSKIKKLILTKNQNYYENDSLISKIILKFFNDTNHFLKHKDTVNLFLDKENIISSSILRLNKFDFTVPQFFSIFLNKDKLKSTDLRTILLNNINKEEILGELGKGYKDIKNPYLTDISIKKDIEKIDIEQELGKLGYFKVSQLINKSLEEKNKEKLKDTFEENNIKSNYIITEEINKKYNFIQKDNILLKGSVNTKKPSAVYINDYKLSGYKKGNDTFFYRLKESYDNIKEGINKYDIIFEIDGKKETIETFSIIYEKNHESLQKSKDELIKNIKIDEEAKVKINEEQVNIINSLDKNYYYNSDNERFTLSLIYIDTQKEGKTISDNIKEKYKNIGIDLDVTSISINVLNEMLSSGEKFYDIILVGINLGYFDFNIFPYFHSSQVKAGYNFSNIKKPGLDYILEELKSKILSKSKTEILEEKILNILKEEQVVKTIFTPIMYNLVDNNIKNYSLNKVNPSSINRNQSLYNSYVSNEKKINFEEKSFKNFISFITQILKKDDGS